MIGALSTVEEHFGFLWDNDESSEEDKKIMKDLYQKIRSEILDKGNNQARNIDAELAQYDVEWLKYSIKIPMFGHPKQFRLELSINPEWKLIIKRVHELAVHGYNVMMKIQEIRRNVQKASRPGQSKGWCSTPLNCQMVKWQKLDRVVLGKI